jgi:hypothetical protein
VLRITCPTCNLTREKYCIAPLQQYINLPSEYVNINKQCNDGILIQLVQECTNIYKKDEEQKQAQSIQILPKSALVGYTF